MGLMCYVNAKFGSTYGYQRQFTKGKPVEKMLSVESGEGMLRRELRTIEPDKWLMDYHYQVSTPTVDPLTLKIKKHPVLATFGCHYRISNLESKLAMLSILRTYGELLVILMTVFLPKVLRMLSNMPSAELSMRWA